MQYLRRRSGYYIDVGASDLVADGDINLRNGVTIEEILQRSVVLNDGSEVPADLIVYATGYGSMSGRGAKAGFPAGGRPGGQGLGLGPDTAKDPAAWKGELRNMWKPTRQKCSVVLRRQSPPVAALLPVFFALQLKARMEGISTPVCGLAEVCHPS
jgi:putative flavoprotein involved in K+ transport